MGDGIGTLNIVFTGACSGLIPRLITRHSVTSVPFNKHCHLVSFALSDVTGTNVSGISIVIHGGCRSLVSRLNTNHR